MSKTLQGHRTKLNKQKTTETPTVNSRSYTVLYNHDRLIIVKQRPKKYSPARDGTSSATVHS